MYHYRISDYSFFFFSSSTKQIKQRVFASVVHSFSCIGTVQRSVSHTMSARSPSPQHPQVHQHDEAVQQVHDAEEDPGDSGGRLALVHFLQPHTTARADPHR